MTEKERRREEDEIVTRSLPLPYCHPLPYPLLTVLSDGLDRKREVPTCGSPLSALPDRYRVQLRKSRSNSYFYREVRWYLPPLPSYPLHSLVPFPYPSSPVLLTSPFPEACRKALYEHVVLAGGSSLFPGLAERFHKELKAIVCNFSLLLSLLLSLLSLLLTR